MERADPWSRRPRALALAVALIASLGAATADLDLLASRLAAEDPQLRRIAIHALADRGGREAVELLAARAEVEADDALRRSLHDALQRVRIEETDVLALLGGSPSPAARAFAAHAAGRLHSAGATGALLTAMRDPEPTVRREVYEALATAGERAAIPELIRAAVRESSPPLRTCAEESARRLADLATRPTDVPAAVAMLDGGLPEDQVWAIRTLGRSGDWRALQVLLGVIEAGPAELKVEALKALGVLGDHRAVPALHGLLASSTGRVRHGAIGALALLADESSLDQLGPLVADPDPAARVLAIRALSQIATPGTVPFLARALKDGEEPVRAEAIHALGVVGGSQVVAALGRALGDPSPFLRAEAARLLAESRAPEATAPLIQALGDPDPLVQLTAAEGLGAAGVEAARPLVESLRDDAPDENLRKAYEAVLERLSAPPTP